jgi:hypothetical protein
MSISDLSYVARRDETRRDEGEIFCCRTIECLELRFCLLLYSVERPWLRTRGNLRNCIEAVYFQSINIVPLNLISAYREGDRFLFKCFKSASPWIIARSSRFDICWRCPVHLPCDVTVNRTLEHSRFQGNHREISSWALCHHVVCRPCTPLSYWNDNRSLYCNVKISTDSHAQHISGHPLAHPTT